MYFYHDLLYKHNRSFHILAIRSVAKLAGAARPRQLVFVPELSAIEARELSLNANTMNGSQLIFRFLIVVLCAEVPLELIPSYGMTEAAWLVLGTLSYVAYRDIFERRSANLPGKAQTGAVSDAVHLTR